MSASEVVRTPRNNLQLGLRGTSKGEKMIRYACHPAPGGLWEAAVREERGENGERRAVLVGLGLLPNGAASGNPEEPTELSRRLFEELDEYLAGKRRTFDIPLEPEGTEFQRAVWEVLLSIPYGETRSYGEVARALGKPAAARAVGGACNRNPILILIPCHRVIGSSGALTGYAPGLEMKRTLLEFEAEHRREKNEGRLV